MKYFLIRMIGSDMEYLVSDTDAIHACHRVRKHVLLYEDVEDDLLPRDYEVQDMLQPEAFLDVVDLPADRKYAAAAFRNLWGTPYTATVQRLI